MQYTQKILNYRLYNMHVHNIRVFGVWINLYINYGANEGHLHINMLSYPELGQYSTHLIALCSIASIFIYNSSLSFTLQLRSVPTRIRQCIDCLQNSMTMLSFLKLWYISLNYKHCCSLVSFVFRRWLAFQ